MSNRRGFTLVEIMVAVGVTLVLVSVMLQVLNQSSAIWTRSNESLDTFREARAAIQLMAREIGQVRAMPVPVTIPPTVGRTFPLLALEAHPESSGSSTANEEIYALTSAFTPDRVAATNSTTDKKETSHGRAGLTAVGYYCRWNEERKAFSLARQFTRSDETYKNLQAVLSSTSPLTGSAAFLRLYSRPPTPAVAGALDSSVDDIATYMWDLHFVFPDNLKLDPGQQQTWPQGEFSQKLPPWIEVRCKALGSLAARRLVGTNLTPEAWFKEDSTTYQRMIKPYQYQFVTRISLAQ